MHQNMHEPALWERQPAFYVAQLNKNLFYSILAQIPMRAQKAAAEEGALSAPYMVFWNDTMSANVEKNPSWIPIRGIKLLILL